MPAVGRQDRETEATVFLEAQPASILDYEDFVEGLTFLDRHERDLLRLAGGEILDNLVRHATPMEENRFTIRAARRRNGILLGFFFRSGHFAPFAANCAEPAILYDVVHRRWRGIGMVMCRNLASRVSYRPGTGLTGTGLDRIFLSFSSDPATRNEK